VSLLDFSRTTYSSARAAMIIAQRAATAEHTSWACKFISRVYRWRVSKWINAGELPAPTDNRPWKHRAIQEPFAYLDPTKDVQGDMMLMDAGLVTHDEMLQARGTTLDEYIRQRKQEISKLEAAGITISKSTSTRDDIEVDAVDPMPTPEDESDE
jgi:capsid protein